MEVIWVGFFPTKGIVYVRASSTYELQMQCARRPPAPTSNKTIQLL